VCSCECVHWRGTRSIWHSQALAGFCRHSQAPCRIEQQLNRARLQLCFEPSLSPQCLTRPSPLTVSPRLRTVLPSFRAIQPAGGHTRVLLCPKTTTTRPRHASCFLSFSCTSPLTLLFLLPLPPLPLVRVSLASLARQPTPSGRRRTGCQRTHLRPPSPQQQTGS
jgi:hypothetical protein